MRVVIYESSVSLWLSARDTYAWANRPGSRWPCSRLSGNRVFASFDSNGLNDLTINGKSADCDVTEFNAITADSLGGKLPKDHPAYFVSVGQCLAMAGTMRN